MRSYLRRCKEVITGHHHLHNQESNENGLRSIASSHEPVIQRQQVVEDSTDRLEVIVHRTDVQPSLEHSVAEAPESAKPSMEIGPEVGTML